ncbi:isocitrate lyase/PEP mutase family protein [Rahnella woolbedingensis]|uniref:Isocitrate lyase/phosphoenolpyruvate mutase family protein n=1 Tax=Rahnella woolbedingensis TaxID=1510574 RepID=A0A419N9E2_9GAMM|nr:isocitrate lyase/phosphoenolpyruvate mutase family protein [Rahnella woolbedingensis]RJT44325.1 isocitrate lyase/phosphoenolpyruvate mutase family protein [Rahnella woolbedingensis]
MSQQSQALAFSELHQKHNPVILYNVWDAGSALAVEQAGAKAIATGSWSCAAAQGYQDGETMSFSSLLQTVQRIAAVISLPLTVDFETGYGANRRDNLSALLQAGVVGINVEDQQMGLSALNDIREQSEILKSLRQVADSQGSTLFINARTDVFLQQPDATQHPALMAEAKKRLTAYQDAGVSGFFAPGLSDLTLIAELCDVSALPVNIMANSLTPPLAGLTDAGISRLSYGPYPYIGLMEALKQQARALY